ncbi:SnoaL-like domain protein [Falsiruegeria litorea R37]|uniref:SnoaL-like domain protein n=1 Tax=Falsiruegeria litorea R37 TaxID=1200284 RepID=A0A1Y5SHC1_9RHOB|nr:nuclear transport factor 2 family protein [Falsiruegeria litorea]SLN37684.1 SnoaL-like domain protein [Falsiruegeria litorea R37]
MASLDAVIEAYGAAWAEKDPLKRMKHLEIAWAEDGRYVDPNGDVSGREGLAGYMDAFHAQAKGSQIVVTSAAVQHHEMVHFTWAMKAVGGIPLLKGHDFGTLDTDGRIKQLVGFFGDPEPIGGKKGLLSWLKR